MFKSITNLVRFRAACLPWRSASLPKQLHHFPQFPNTFRPPPQLPWLMIPYYPDTEDTKRYFDIVHAKPKDDGIRLFYDLWQSKMHKLHLPETIGKMCCASYRGWLVLVSIRGTEVFLLNPLTRARIQLPPFSTPVKVFGAQEDCRYEAHYWFEPYIGNFVISKLSFSTDPTDPNCVIMVFLQKPCRLFFCRVGDPCWTMVNTQPEEIRIDKFSDATYHDGWFYLLSHDGVMRVYDLNNPKERFKITFEPKVQSFNKMFLEGKSGVYMVVNHVVEEDEEGEAAEAGPGYEEDTPDEEKGKRQKVELYRLLEPQFGLWGLEKVEDTSDTTIFYGDNHLCFAVSSDDSNSLAGGSVYAQYICAPTASKAEREACNACYGIYVIKMGDGWPKVVVRDLGERPRLWPAAPAMWFQPSYV